MGYSNVTGDLNVYSSTSTQTLTVRGDTVISGNVTAPGQSTFGNVTVSNLSIVGSVFNVATNVQISNAISINNAGTSTVLKVVQYEGGGGGHIYNVAEFWDFQTLAMCIDPRGNVAIHQAASPGYALTVNEGVRADNVTVTGNYTGSGFGLTNVPVTGLYGAVGSLQVQNTQTNVTSVGTLWTVNVTGISNLNGSILGSLATPVQSNITTVGLLTNLAVSNSISVSNIVATGNLTVLTQSNLASANIQSLDVVSSNVSAEANITTLSVATGNVQSLNVSVGANITQLSVTSLANLVSANLVTANTQSLNAVTANVTSGNVQSLVVTSGANVTVLTVGTLANISSANLVTANIQSLNVVGSNTQTLNVSTGANITQLSVTTLANLISANLVTANVQSLNVVSSNISILNVNSGANITTLTVSTLANLVTANVQSLNVVTSNTQTLNVSTGANITQLSVTTLANLASANLVTANIESLNVVSSNIQTLNVSAGANITTLTVSTLANISSANLVTANVQSLNVVSSNIQTLNVSAGANITQLSVTSLANISSANLITSNIQSLNVVSSNVSILNVNSGANVTYLTVSSQSNVVSANLVTANIQTANVTTMNLLNLNVTSTANFASANFASANIANIYTTNIVGFVGSQWVGTIGGPLYYATGNVGINTSTGLDSNLTVAGNLFVSTNISTPVLNVTSYANVSVLNVSTSANIVTANLITANIANIFTTNIVGFVGSQWSGTTGGPLSYASGNVAIGSSTNPGANLTVTGNLFVSNSITTANVIASGTITGTWNGVSQGTLLTLATNTATGTAFATSSDAPTLQAYHVPLQSFTQNAIQAVSSYTITAQGLIKFSSTGLYQLTTALVMDSPVVKVALGTNTSSAFLSSTSAYTYVYTISSAASPSDSITIPINVQDISKYYYLDVFCRSAVTSGTYYLTAGTTVTGSQNGTYIQIAPFGNYISSSVNAAAGILLTTTGSTLSSPLAAASPLPTPSNTYHVTMTSGAGWSQSGTSSIVTVSPNGNLQFYQAGVFNVTICLNSASPRVPMQVGIGSSSSDSSLPTTIGSYVYSYAPMFTQDPTTTIMVPLNVTDITKYYYLDATFDPSTTVTLVSTSTFVAVTPLSSYIPSPMATASVVVSQVVTARSTSYTATSSDYYIGMSNGGTVTIPQGATLTRGKVYNIKDESGLAGTNTAYNIIIQMSGADKIDGQSNAYIQLGWTSVNLMWTGENNKWSFI